MRGGADPLTPISAEATLAQNTIGGNVGNLLYLYSSHKVLSVPGTEITVDGYWSETRGMSRPDYADLINERFDHYVLPMANTFRRSFIKQVDRMTDVISKLNIPVTVVGIGSQQVIEGQTAKDMSEVGEATKRFMNAVLDRSATVGVRGTRTADYLKSLGYGDDKVTVIGCPSMYQFGADVHVEKRVERIETDTPFSVNTTQKVAGLAELIDAHAEKYPNMTYAVQDRDTLALMMWGAPYPGGVDPTMPTSYDHPLYQQDRMRFFLNPSTWMDFMRTQEFSFGSRIHGNLIALLAGTPSMVLAHDSRTLELAEFFEIPRRELSQVPANTDVNDLYAEADYTAFNNGHAARFQNFTAFLAKNNLPHIFSPGNDNPEYRERQAAIPYPPPVHTLASADPQWRRDVASRLAWLREDFAKDRARMTYGYRKPFPPAVAKGASPDLEKRTREQAKQLALQANQLTLQAKQLAAQQRELDRLRASVLLRAEGAAQRAVDRVRKRKR